MGAAVAIGSVFSGLLGAYGSYQQGKAAQAAYEQQAAAADRNARMANAQADEALSRGAREETKFRRRARQGAAATESALAASGGTMSGSALEVMADTAAGIEQDVMSLRYNAAQERRGFQTQAADYANQAGAARAAGANAKRAGRIGAFTSLLGMGAGFAAAGTAKASYQAGGGISVEAVEPRYQAYYNSPNNKFGTVTNNRVPMQWWRSDLL